LAACPVLAVRRPQELRSEVPRSPVVRPEAVPSAAAAQKLAVPSWPHPPLAVQEAWAQAWSSAPLKASWSRESSSRTADPSSRHRADPSSRLRVGLSSCRRADPSASQACWWESELAWLSAQPKAVAQPKVAAWSMKPEAAEEAAAVCALAPRLAAALTDARGQTSAVASAEQPSAVPS
jgi:hypothetical protein